ncbi:hypothetical protein MPSEU_000274100 [Mayamaea pseudoterrestris]|nr:hypothetical protein MPSEU_000274100 [Mayamaea pseudoterrestris]
MRALIDGQLKKSRGGDSVHSNSFFLHELREELMQRECITWMQKEENELERNLNRIRDKGKIHTFYSGSSNFKFTTSLLVLITHRPDLRKELFQTLEQNSATITKLDFLIDNTLRDDLPERMGSPDTIDLIMAATELGQVLGTLNALHEVNVRMEEDVGPCSSIFLATAVLGCRQAKHLCLQPDSIEDESLPPFIAYIRNHPCLEEVYLTDHTSDDVLVAILEPVASLKRLTTFTLVNTDVVSEAAARLIQRVLRLPTMTKATLHNLIVETDAVADALCSGLAKSSVNELELFGLKLPTNKFVPLAKAFTRSKLTKLTLTDQANNPEFFDAFGNGLAAASCTIRQLSFDSQNIIMEMGECLAIFLRHAPSWRLRHLQLDLRRVQWSDAIGIGISAYVASNKYLRYLCLDCVHEEGSRQWLASEQFLSALGDGEGSIDEIKFNGTVDQRCIARIKEKVAFNLNRQRRLHGPLLSKLAHTKPGLIRQRILSKSLAAVDASARYAFLSGNEWQCCDIMLHEVSYEKNKKRKRSRPAQLEP